MFTENELDAKTLQDIKKRVILTRFIKYNGNRTHTAKSLGIGLRTLQRNLIKYNVPKGKPSVSDET